MTSAAMKSFLIGALGIAALAGCASSPSSPSSPSMASTPKGVQSGKVAAVENVAIVDQATVGSSSGSGGTTTVTTVSGGPSAITVRFDDGKESKYVIENPKTSHNVGDPVYVITDGDRTAIMPVPRQ
jgi:outer membrane lipoprotein SlyB